MRAPPRGFSQLTASFLAGPCLGIHRAPLFRLTGTRLSCPRPGPPIAAPTRTHTHTRALPYVGILPRFPFHPGCQIGRPLPGREGAAGFGKSASGLLGRSTCEAVSAPPGRSPEGKRPGTGAYSALQKGGDPAAGSPTATLLRLRPSHRARLRPLPPCGWLTDFGRSPLPWRDGRCVQGPGTYSPWCS